jgi:phosphoribosyl 1,2-cyclic phosphodiesterase
MKVRFWGTRGSIPVSITAKDVRAKIAAALRAARDSASEEGTLGDDAGIERFIDGLGFALSGTYGGHSSCVEIETGNEDAGNEHLLCDMGSGVRAFGESMMKRYGPARQQTYHVFMSHVHWDHIMGFPYFMPVYIPGNRIVIHGCHAELEHAFKRQQAVPSFPVDFSLLGSNIEFDVIAPGETRSVAGVTVSTLKQRHSGDSYGWRFEGAGKSVVYSTDSEHRLENAEETKVFVDFFRNADLVIFDAMYSLADAISVKADWGHSSNILGVELCQMAGVRRLCMFHHEPAYDDGRIDNVLAETRRFEEITRSGSALEVLSAWDGLEIAV